MCRRLQMQGCGVGAIDWWKAVGEAAKGQTGSAAPFGHGGEVITSVMLALAPGAVDMESAQDESPLPALSFVAAHGPGSAFVAYGNFRDYCRSGAWGEVRGIATAEKGRAWIDKQNDIRMKRDTLNSGAVLDLDDGPVTINLQDDGKHFM